MASQSESIFSIDSRSRHRQCLFYGRVRHLECCSIVGPKTCRILLLTFLLCTRLASLEASITFELIVSPSWSVSCLSAHILRRQKLLELSQGQLFGKSRESSGRSPTPRVSTKSQTRMNQLPLNKAWDWSPGEMDRRQNIPPEQFSSSVEWTPCDQLT